jgi:Ca-activated chloride channel family protein
MGLSNLGAFHFLYPAWLLTLPPLLGLALWFVWRQRQAGGWLQVLDADLFAALRLQDGDRRSSPWLLIGIGWTVAALALAGPAWQRIQSAAFRAPENWVLVLDLSPSMAVADLPPDRATRARYAIDDLLRAAHDANIGLIVFAGEAHIVVPLTSDVATVRALLQPLSPAIMPEAGDDLAPALDDAGQLLRQAGSRNSKVIVLSDGYDDPDRVLAAAKSLREQGAVIEVVGIGTANGAPEMNANGSFVQDAQGRSVMAKLPIGELQGLAAAGGGRYWPLTDLNGLVNTLRAERSNPLEQDQLASNLRVDTWRNEGIWLLPPLLLLAAAFARRGWL